MSAEETQMASIIIGDSTALRIFTTMLEKHEKGTLATKNTVEAFGGDSHAMDSVIAHIAHWRRQTALQGELLSPKGDAAAAGTPLGAELVRAEQDGARGARFAEWVPRPFPQVGQFVRWPSGTATSITSVVGFTHPELKGDEDEIPLELLDRLVAEGEFEVEDSEGWRGLVQSHFSSEHAAIEWRVRSDDYATARVAPVASLDEAVERVVSGSEESDVLDDYSTGTPQEAEEGTPAERAASAADTELNAKAQELGWKDWDSVPADANPGERASEYAMRKSRPKGKAARQRERNRAQAGVTRPAPKPSAAKKAARKGGR